jgi:hypothetical protein
MLPTCNQLLTFQQITVPSSSRSGSPKCLDCLTLHMKHLQSFKYWQQFTSQHGTTCQNIWIFSPHHCENLISQNKTAVLHTVTVNLARCLQCTDHITQEGWWLTQFYSSVRFWPWYITTKVINFMDFFHHHTKKKKKKSTKIFAVTCDKNRASNVQKYVQSNNV